MHQLRQLNKLKNKNINFFYLKVNTLKIKMSKKGEKESIFNLSTIGAHQNDTQVKEIPAEDNPLLKNYKLVPKDEWANIQPRSHIRYKRLDTGELRRGGYLVKVTPDQDQELHDTLKFDLVSNFKPDAVKWSVYAGSIEKIWVKPDIGFPPVIMDLTEIKNDIKYCKEQIELLRSSMQKMNMEQIESRFQKIADEQMRTVILIKKLHKIN
jgi:hypothetical protein